MKHNPFLLAPIMLLFLVNPANAAISGSSYMNDLDDVQREAFLFGALEMAISIYSKEERGEKAVCVGQWFSSSREDAEKEIMAFMFNPNNGKYTASGLIGIVVDRHCPDDPKTTAQPSGGGEYNNLTQKKDVSTARRSSN